MVELIVVKKNRVSGAASSSILQHATPHGGQDSCANGGSECHLGGWGATELDGVALVC